MREVLCVCAAGCVLTQGGRYVRKRKGDINPNPGFKKELKEYEKVPLVAFGCARVLCVERGACDARAQVILGDGAVVCGLPVIFESVCEKKGGGPDGQRNWLKGGRRNWKERHLRLTSRWLQYLDGFGGRVKGSREVKYSWVIKRDPAYLNAIVIECDGNDIFHARFTSEELRERWEQALVSAATASPMVDLKPNFALLDSIFQSS